MAASPSAPAPAEPIKLPPECRFRSRLRPVGGSGILMAPLLDMVFILLIFFMMGSSAVVLPGMVVSLPEVPDDQQPPPAVDKLVVSYTRDRQIFFNDQSVNDFNELENKLHDAIGLNSTDAGGRRPVIILRADRDAAYQNIVALITLCRRHASSVFLVTETPRN